MERFGLLHLVILLTGIQMSEAETITECLEKESSEYPLDGIQIADEMFEDEHNTLTSLQLFEANVSLDWCAAYHQCKKRDSRLVVISDNDIQAAIERLINNVNVTTGNAWISARRKDYGVGWTWLNENLDDCDDPEPFECSTAYDGASEYGSLKKVVGIVQGIEIEEMSGTQGYICTHIYTDMGIDVTNSWYDAQNKCSQSGGRLATYFENHNVTGDAWNGFRYKPWIWITGDADAAYKPMIYSSWVASKRKPVGDDCLTIELEMEPRWSEELCGETLDYFICEEDVDPPTTGTTTTPSRPTSSNGPPTGPKGKTREFKIGVGVGVGLGVPVLAGIIALSVYFGVNGKKKKNSRISNRNSGEVTEGLDKQSEKGKAGRTSGRSSHGFPSIASNYIVSDYDEMSDASKNIPPPNSAPPPKPSPMGPDPTYALATDPNKPVRLVSSPIGPYSEVEVNQFHTRNAFDDNRGSRIMVDNKMYGGPADQQPKQKPGKFNKPPPGKPKGPEKPPKPGSMTKPQVATVIPIRHTLGPKGDEYAEIQKGDTIKK